MNTIKKLFRRFLCSNIIILLFFLMINFLGGIIFLKAVKTHTVDADKEIKEIAKGISQNDN